MRHRPLVIPLLNRQLGAVVALVVVTACSGEPGAGPSHVGGVVIYRQDVSLPQDARLVIILADVTEPVPRTLVEDTTDELGSVPIPFELNYDTAAIDPNRLYAVAARIVRGTELLFMSVKSKQVITQGNPTRIQLEVVPSGAMGPLPPRAAEIAARLFDYERVDGTWQEGDAGSMISAYFENGVLLYLEERMTIGEYGSAANAYFFDEDALFYMETLKRLVERSRSSPDEREEIAFRLLFGPDGTLLESLKWVDGETAELNDQELRSTLRHAAVVREAALRLAAGGPEG